MGGAREERRIGRVAGHVEREEGGGWRKQRRGCDEWRAGERASAQWTSMGVQRVVACGQRTGFIGPSISASGGGRLPSHASFPF